MVGWAAFAVIAVITTFIYVILFFSAGRRISFQRIPIPVISFVVLCALSIFWSQYRLETLFASLILIVTTLAGVMVAISFPLPTMIKALLRSSQWSLLLGIPLELYAALIQHGRVIPLYMHSWKDVPELYYWSNGLLFKGGPIQGFVGNRNPLAFLALITLICLVLLYFSGRENKFSLFFWSLLSFLILILTRSATVIMAIAGCIFVLVAALLIKKISPNRRRPVVISSLCVAIILAVGMFVFHDSITGVLGRSGDLTGRAGIWERVINLWELRPIVGWGWIMIWVPWIPMFRYLVVRGDGTPTMQAHNAYVETLFQTGIIGLTILVIAIAVILFRTFRVAYRTLDTDFINLAPALLMTAMFIQSFSESRLLSEGNWLLFAAIGTWLTFRIHNSYEEKIS